MTSILVAGYKSFELGIFNDKDPKISVIKKAIERDLLSYCDQGLEWLIFTGNLGFEYWAFEVAESLKEEYGFQTAAIFPFQTHGQNWNESNQEKLRRYQQADFVKCSYETYHNPRQFRQYHQFLIHNTDQAYVFYDEDAGQSKLHYFIQMMRETPGYPVDFLTFDRLNEILSEDQ